MINVHVLFHESGPVAAFGSSAEAMCAVHNLPGSFDPDLFLVAVPFQPVLVAMAGQLVAVGREPGASPAAPAVTLSPNRDKIR